MTEPASAIELWKRKYYDAIEELDRREQAWAHTEEVLRRAVSRLSLAADGLDDRLDEALDRLRSAIRDRADARTLEHHLERISHLLVRLDQRRAQEAALPGPAEVLLSLVDALDLEGPAARALHPLRKRLARAGREAPGELVREVAKVLARQLRAGQAEAGPVPEAKGWLARLQPRRHPRARESGPDQAAQGLLACLDRLRERGVEAPGLGALRHRLEAEPEAVEEVARSLAALWPRELSAPTGEGQAVSERFAELVERLPLPEGLRERAEAIARRLRDGALEVSAAVEQVVQLVQDLRRGIQRERQELQTFLEQLTERLDQIDTAVRESERARTESYEEGRRLGEAVRSEVRGIEDGVRTASDLGELREILQVRIEGILHHLEEHRRAEAARKQETDARMAELTRRLESLEREAATLRDQVRAERAAALTDPLTGIPNRLAWEERAAQEEARWRRFGHPLAVLVWDIDHFKHINDHYGHSAGDKVLKVVAELLAGHVRSTDFVARYGGEEFVMLAVGAGAEDVLRLAETLREAVSRCGFRYRGERVQVTVSCGIALLQAGEDLAAAFRRADAALYAAKRGGRNRCVLDGETSA